MSPEKLLEVMHLAEKLKDTPRHCYTSKGRREDVAEHSWRIALMAYFVSDEFPEADMNRVIRMCLVHDLGEAFTGDIPTFKKTKADEKKEIDMLYDWVSQLPEPFCTDLRALYEEMEARQTLEAKIYKVMDSFEAVIQHNESDISTWEPHEYDLNRDYAWDRAAFSGYLTELRKAIRKETDAKIEAAATPNETKQA